MEESSAGRFRPQLAAPSPALGRAASPVLSERQGQVLQAVVTSYVAGAAPVSSDMIASLLPVSLSSASVRNTLTELSQLGLVEKPHRSAGRKPSERGLRVFVGQLLAVRELGAFEKRELEGSLTEGSPRGVAQITSRLLSERTGQLGFVMAPRLEGLVLRHVSFVRVSSERVLAVLISRGGRAFQRVLDEPGQRDQGALDSMAALLNERIVGQTLREVRDRLMREALALRSKAEMLLERVLRIDPDSTDGLSEDDLVVATRLALLDQPEFRDPLRLRTLLGTVEEKERIIALLGRMLEDGRVGVLFGEEAGEPGLRDCALVAAPYGRGGALGSVGVIGPSRMDYARVIPLVGFVSGVLTEMLDA